MRQMACHPDLVLKSKTSKTIGALLQSEEFSINTCRICLDEAEDAIMSACRHIYCRECIREVVEGSGEDNAPECPVCHARMIINLEQPAIELEETDAKSKSKQGMLDRIDPSKWRTSTKIEALVEELHKIRTDSHTSKALVFSQSTSFLDLIARRLQLAGFKLARLQGSMSPEQRDRTIKYFDDNQDVTVFLLSLKAGGVALNLVEANYVFLVDPWLVDSSPH
jgi:DNA repair protein RAD16